MYVSVCVLERVQVHMCAHVYGGQWTSLGTIHLLIEAESLTGLECNQIAGRLAGELLGSTCLCLSSVRIASMLHHAWPHRVLLKYGRKLLPSTVRKQGLSGAMVEASSQKG